MKKTSKIMFSILFSVIFIMALSSNASATLITPASSSTVVGTSFLNATNVSGQVIAGTSCTFWARSTSTANSTWVNLTSTTNSSGGANTSFYTSFDSTLLEDSNDYQFLAECENATSSYNSSANTGITIDNTIPQTPSSLSPAASSTDTDGSVTFSATVTGANTTGCTLYFSGRNPGSSSYTMTHTGSTCTYTLSSVLDETYVYYIRASDGTNTTDSAETRFNVLRSAGSSGYLFQNQEAQQIKQQKEQPLSFAIGDVNIPGWAIALIVVLAIIVIIIARRD